MNICFLILKCLLSSTYQIWLRLECKPNISSQLDNQDNCDHNGFYGQYGQKLPAMMITVA